MPKQKTSDEEKNENTKKMVLNDFQELEDKITTIEAWVKSFEGGINTIKKEITSIREQLKAQEEENNKKFVSIKNTLNSVQNQLKTQEELFSKKFNTIKKETTSSREQIKTQEEVFKSKFTDFAEQYLIDKKNISAKLQEIESEHDTMKISLTISESHLLKRLKDMVSNEIKASIKGKEQELLMNLWIDELNEIVSNFEKLKKMHPKEFALRLNEISRTIDLFRQNLKK